MTEPSADELAIRYWLQSARDRLERAERYDCRKNPALGCEDAQQAVEMALKALITARGSAFKRTHEIEHLFQHLEMLGETAPNGVRDAEELSDFGGAERYGFITGTRSVPTIESYERATVAARQTLEWSERRIAELRPEIPLTNPRDDYAGKDPKGGTPRTRESAGAVGHEDGSVDPGPGEPFKGGVPDRAALRYRTRSAVDSGRGHESSWDRD